jgi:lipopolysaccharide export system permease protein
MVFTLHRYIFRELLRVFILATVGLTLILSLGSILRPVQEYGVGPRQVLDILLYFMPITLTFVLPMAALFASALTYGRFASDNEIDACRASGIGIFTLIYPGLMLALLVAIVNLLLSFHVMPYFVHRASKSLKADAKQILFRNLQRRGFYSLPPEKRYLIYADYADPKESTLFGIVAVRSEDDGVGEIFALEAARMQFRLHDQYNEVELTTHNAWQIGAPANDLWGHVGAISVKQEFGSLLGDDIKFKRIEEMKQIRGNLMLFEPVARVARAAYMQLATELLARDISAGLSAAPGGFYELQSPTRSIRFSAKTCALQEQGAVTLLAPIMVEERERISGQYVRRLECEKAALRMEEESAGLRLSLDIRNARVEETGQLLIQYGIMDLAVPEGISRRLTGRPLLETVATAEMPAVPGGPAGALSDNAHLLGKLQQTLRRKINGTLTDIRSEMNSRLVFGIGCIPMILIGIGLGIIQKGGHLLGAFGASCVPGALLAIAIISGKHVAENSHTRGPTGILIMWGGLAFLVLLALLIYRRLRRA